MHFSLKSSAPDELCMRLIEGNALRNANALLSSLIISLLGAVS